MKKLKKSKKPDTRKTVTNAEELLEVALDHNEKLQIAVAQLEAELESCERERDNYL